MSKHRMVSYEELIAEISRLQMLVDNLEHQHRNDEFANKILLKLLEEKDDVLRPIQ